MSDRALLWFLGILVFSSVGLWVGVGYVVFHFIWKYW